MELRSGIKAILPSKEISNIEEELGSSSDEEPSDPPSSSDDDSVDAEFQGDEEEEVDPNYDLPNPLPDPAPAPALLASVKRKRGKRSVLGWQIQENEINRWIDEHLTEDIDLDQQNAVIAETAEPPSDLIMPLLRYQKEFLAWAIKQEQSVAGGILADEMGMGKTMQAISLVLARREFDRAQFGDGMMGCTLVVCPLVAVTQWSSEIARFTSPGSTRVLVYHGAKREKNVKEFMTFDFVLTTYSTVESAFRRNVMQPMVECQYCSKSVDPRKLKLHQRRSCGPYTVKTEKQSKQKRKNSSATSSMKGKDADEGEDSKMKRSKKKTKQTEDLLDSVDSEKSLLHSVKWNRIILDEAHYIKQRRSKTAKAVFALKATYRWAVSGTPLQNQVGELYSLIRFLQVPPYSYHFCKDCDCRTLDYVAHESCPTCSHVGKHFCWWKKYVVRPIGSYRRLEEGKRAMILFKHKVLKDILLRRTKLGRIADLALPPRIITLRRDALDVKEADYYRSLHKDSHAEFNVYTQTGPLMNNYAHIIHLLTRLRLAANHPYLVVYSSSGGDYANWLDLKGIEQECGICHEPAEDNIVTSCAHVFCKACLIGFSSSLTKVTCPTCSKRVTVDLTAEAETEHQASKTTLKGFTASSILNRIKLDDFQTSTKIEALREEIRFMLERDGSAKALVFSQFTSFLDLINYALGKSGISCVQLVGSMSLAARDAATKKFREDPDCRVFLMSLKAGGVALNLTVASHVFMMDPWWNPALERQAQDRIHRIGQHKPIRIVRFIIENSIEERILELQKKKELGFEGTIGGSQEALGKLTYQDMMSLFSTNRL